MSRSRWIFVMVAALSVGAACSDDPVGGAQAGALVVRLTTPHADDGAVMFEVSGPAIDTAIVVNASLRLFTRRASSSTIVAVVVGAVGSGAVVTLQVPDVGAVAGYTARVLEVADRQSALRASLTGYALTVGP